MSYSTGNPFYFTQNKYQIVERRALQFLMGKIEWVYMCSCDMKKAYAVKHLSTTLQTTYDGNVVFT